MDWFDELGEMNKPKVEKRPWMEKMVMELVTVETLDRVIDECINSKSGHYAWDVETTGLDSRVFYGDDGTPSTVDKIVGHCLSPDGKRGYYIPVRHMDEGGDPHKANIPIKVANKALKRLADSKAVAIFHNGKFDHEMLQFGESEPLGTWDDPASFEDTIILAYLRNTRERRKGLKALAMRDLGFEMIELADLFTDEQKKKGGLNFSQLDPTWDASIWYGCSDAICTYLLWEVIHPGIMDPEPTGNSQSTVYTMEKMCLPATRWMERCRIYINRDKVMDLIRLGQAEWFESLEAIYVEAAKILGRDVRPGWYRLMRGTVDDIGAAADHYKFDPTQMEPDYVTARDDAAKAAKQFRIDPTAPDGKGKERIRTIVKEVPTLLDPKKKERVPFLSVYDVTIPAQLGMMLREMGVKGLKPTEKSGQVKTDQKTLDIIIETASKQFPFMGKVQRFRQTKTALANNLFPVLRDTTHERAPDGCVRVNFNGHKVDTGRFATPKPRLKEFFGQVRWNLHSIPATYQKDRPECMLRIRECVQARPGKVLFACVAEGTLIQTGRGLTPIEDVQVGDTVITNDGHHEVTRAICNGTRNTIEVHTELGFSAPCTDDHLVMTVDSGGLAWKTAGELMPGDWVCLVADHPTHQNWPTLPPLGSQHGNAGKVEVPPVLTVDLAEFFGRMMGDGCITGSVSRGITSFSIALGGDAEVLSPQIKEHIKNWFGLSHGWLGEDGTLAYSSRSVSRWLKGVLAKGNIHTLRVPDSILHGPVAGHRAFLRGLFDADGSVGSRGGDGVSLWITSDEMAQQVQILLLQDGILARRRHERRTTNYGEQEGWRITVNGIRSLARFRSRIGFVTPRKVETLKKIHRSWQATDFIPLTLAKKAVVRQSRGMPNATIRNGRRKGRVTPEALERCEKHARSVDPEWMDRLVRGSLRFDRVGEIRSKGPAAVYDLTIPTAGRFSAGGLVVHNCDYAGVELRIVTNISGEPKWFDEFFRCSSCDHKFARDKLNPPPPFCPTCGSDKIGDLHSLTAFAVYGEGIKGTKEFKGKRQKAKCVHPDTLITTAQGRIRIGDLDFGDDDTFHPVSGIKILNPERQYIPVKETYNGGLKPLYHIITRRGVLTCSSVHRIALADGTLKSIETGLAPGDILPDTVSVPEDRRKFPAVRYLPFKGVPSLSYQTDVNTAYFAGLHAGDGCSSEACAEISHGTVGETDQLGVPYEEWQSIIYDACQSVGLEPRAKLKKVYLGSRHVLRWMQALGMVKGAPPTKRTFRVPSWVLQAGRLAMFHYLGGLIDTDGTVSPNGDLSITTKDFVFAGQVAELFRAVGCSASVGTSWNKTYERHYLKVSVKRRDGKSLRPFIRHPGKRARISDTEVGYDRWDNEVLLIEPAGEGWCVDLHVASDDHLYVANGLATHNSLNFAMCYGGGGAAAQRAVDVDRDEGWRIKRQFDATYTGLTGWWKRQQAFARRYKFVTTAFGRRYPLPDIDHENKMFVKKAERNAVNGPVQGTSADITKLAMALVYRLCKKRGWLRRVLLTITIHDELVFEIDEAIAEEASTLIVEAMTRNKAIMRLPHPIPYKCDVEFGDNWTVKHNLTEMAHNAENDKTKHLPGGGQWDARLARVFPKAYASFLAHGGVPLEGVEAPKPPDDGEGGAIPAPETKTETPATTKPAPKKAAVHAFTAPETGKGKVCVHVIHTSQFDYGMMDRLASVIHKVEGRGLETLRIETEDGVIIYEDPNTTISAVEFKVLAGNYRV